MRVETGLLDGLPDAFVHHLDRPGLPVEDLLDRSACRVTLRKHGDDDVGREPLIHGNLVDDLLGYFTRNGVMAVGITVIVPGVGRSQKVLVLYVDEVLRISYTLETDTGK